MQMLVAIQMGNHQPQALDARNLRLAFRIELLHADSSLQEGLDERHMIREKPPLRRQQATHLVNRKHRMLCHQGNMRPDAKLRMLPGQFCCFLYGTARRHQRGAAQTSFFISFYNGMIDGRMQAEIIGIYD